MILFFSIVIALIKTNELKKFNLFINFVSTLIQRLNIFFFLFTQLLIIIINASYSRRYTSF